MTLSDIDAIFEQYIPAKLDENLDAIRNVDATIKIVVSGSQPATWIIDLSQDKPSVIQDERDTDCTVTIDAQLLQDIINGKSDPLAALMDGKIQFEGDLEKASAMGLIF